MALLARLFACSFLAVGLVLPAAAQTGSVDDIEARVAEIEWTNISAPWPQSAALIDALAATRPSLSPEHRYRIDLVRARNLALANQFDASLAMVRELLDRQVSDALRLRTLILGINISTDSADLSRAFAWLHEGLVLLDNVDHAHPRLLGVASYLYLRAGEEEGALDYARRSLELARKLGDSRSECVALSDLGHALKDAGRHSEAMPIRHLQVAACDEVGDPVFVADGYRGIGQSLVRLGRANEALRWLNDAINRFDDTGYGRGAREARLVLAEALYESGADPLDALGLLETLTPDFEADSSWTSIETARRLWSRIEEARGRHQEALTHVRLAQEARTRIDQEARARRLSFLQVQFDTRLKEHQIALLDSERERQAAELEARRRTQWLQAMGLGGLVVAAGLLALMLGRSRSERRRFRRLSEIDGLTGLSNHQHTRYCGQVAYERAMRDLSPFTAVVADIDRFKRINDRYGHATGDAVLRRLGELVREVFPERAVKGRTGGEEFTVLIDANAAQTRFLIDDLRRRIAPIEVFGHHVEYRLSFGLSEANENHAALEDLLHAADMALYQAKRSGRDRVMDAAYLPEVRRHEPGLVVVGSGIQLGRHLSQRCLSEIEEAEKVLAVTDAAAFAMIQDIRPDVIDLRSHYAEGKDRRQTYREMDEAIMAEVRAGYRVCVVFYGHPGVFADVPHAVIRKAREAGFSARMEPGISADACLYADLGIDPGRHGVLSLEATQFLVEDRQLDSRSLVLLWQVALTGDLACTRFHAEPDQLAHLVDRLLLDYPPNHEVILYEAAHLPIQPFRAERLSLSELPRAHYKEYTTLVIPPRTDRAPNLASQLRETLRQAGSANEGARREGEDTRDRHE